MKASVKLCPRCAKKYEGANGTKLCKPCKTIEKEDDERWWRNVQELHQKVKVVRIASPDQLERENKEMQCAYAVGKIIRVICILPQQTEKKIKEEVVIRQKWIKDWEEMERKRKQEMRCE